jgi:DNA-binding GntR family transcriptional regulator
MVMLGQLRPGQRLNEVELANALGISRGPLREAISRLRSEGLLTAVLGRGAYVRTFTPDALADIYEVRIALETHAVRLAARTLGPDDVAELREMLDAADQSVAAEQTYPHELDLHQRIVALAGSPALLDAVTEIHRQVHLARWRSGHHATRAKLAVEEHRAVLDHLAAGDGEAAAALLEEHLRLSLRSALQLLDPDGNGSPPPTTD